MDRSTARVMGDGARAVLEKWASKNGYVLKPGPGRYDDTSLTVKFTIVESASSASKSDKSDAVFLGLPADVVGKTFTNRGIDYVVTDLVLRRHKFPVSATRIRDGRTYKFPVSAVNAALSPNAASLDKLRDRLAAGKK